MINTVNVTAHANSKKLLVPFFPKKYLCIIKKGFWKSKIFTMFCLLELLKVKHLYLYGNEVTSNIPYIKRQLSKSVIKLFIFDQSTVANSIVNYLFYQFFNTLLFCWWAFDVLPDLHDLIARLKSCFKHHVTMNIGDVPLSYVCKNVIEAIVSAW